MTGDAPGRRADTYAPADGLEALFAAELHRLAGAALDARLDERVRLLVREELARAGAAAGDPETASKARAARLAGVSVATLDRWQRAGRLSRGHRGRVRMAELRLLLAGEQPEAAAAVDLAAERAQRAARAMRKGGR